MRTVWKYELNMGPTLESRTTELSFPPSSVVVHVGLQEGKLCICVEKSTQLVFDRFDCTYYVIGTGHEKPKGHAHMDHKGSVLDGIFVWHVYCGW